MLTLMCSVATNVANYQRHQVTNMYNMLNNNYECTTDQQL